MVENQKPNQNGPERAVAVPVEVAPVFFILNGLFELLEALVVEKHKPEKNQHLKEARAFRRRAMGACNQLAQTKQMEDLAKKGIDLSHLGRPPA